MSSRRKMESSSPTLPSILDLSFDKFRQQHERFLPSEITCFRGNGGRNAFLNDVYFRAAGNFLQRDRSLHFTSQVRIVKFVRVTDALVRLELEVSSPEGMALAGREIGERHFVTAANFGVEMMDFARESVRRKPFCHRLSV